MAIPKRSMFRRIVSVSCLALLLSVGLAAEGQVAWTVIVVPGGAGHVDWTTSSPAANGTVDKKRKIPFDKNTFLDLTFGANPGFRLVSVFKDRDEWTNFLDAQNHFRFGPAGSSHRVVARFEAIAPTGTFSFATPLGNVNVPEIVDVTGNYTGISATKGKRIYNVDAAMDEAGKLSAMGTIDGIEPDGGGPITGYGGSLKTINGTPTLQAKTKFSGTRDGDPTTASGTVTAPAKVQDMGGGSLVAEGTASFKANVGGVPFRDKNVPVQAPVDQANADNLSRDWSIRTVIREAPSAKGSKTRLLASATLTLPTGDTIEFAEKKAKFNPKKGYTLSFTKGTNTTRNPSVIDKKTKIKIKRMTLVQQGPVWQPTGGTIQYKFLGQKGTADLLEFVNP